MGQMIVPTVLEATHLGERAMDIYSRLLNSRIVFLHGPIDDALASLVIAQLLHLGAWRGPDRFSWDRDHTGLWGGLPPIGA